MEYPYFISKQALAGIDCTGLNGSRLLRFVGRKSIPLSPTNSTVSGITGTAYEGKGPGSREAADSQGLGPRHGPSSGEHHAKRSLL